MRTPSPPPAAVPLAEARVLVVGAGGLGCPASLALAHGGVGALTLCDPDRVDPTNLHRQLWHRDADVGRPKVHSAAEGLARAFPRLAVEPREERVGAHDAERLFRAHDLVVDATDGTATKFLLSDAAVQTGVPLVYGGVLRMEGQALLVAPGGPCLRCVYGAPPPPDQVPTCAQAGVLGSVAGAVGALQALLALEWLGGARPPEGEATLHRLDGRALAGRAVRVTRDPDCARCRTPDAPLTPPEEEALRCNR